MVSHFRWRPIIAFFLYALLTLALTWPIATHLNDDWLADSTNDPDAFLKLWDIDYLGRMLQGEPEQTFFHTTLLFHPNGLDLTYHTFHVPHMLVAYALRPALGLIGAFNATSLLMIFVTALSGYALLRELLPEPETAASWGAALFGGAVFAFSQWVLYNLRHPDLAFLATQALALLFTLRLLRGKGWTNAVLAGLMIGITAYVGLYILVATGLMLAVLIAAAFVQRYAHLPRRQKTKAAEDDDSVVVPQPRFPWLSLILLGIVAAALAAPRLLPMVQGNLGFALTAKYSQYYAWESVDLVHYVVPAYHPTFEPQIHLADGAKRYHMYYLGWSVMALALLSLIPRQTRGRAFIWLLATLFFMWLALGTRMNINGKTYDNIPMLKPMLEGIPVIFKAFGRPDNFFVGITLPLSVAAAIGLWGVLRGVGRWGTAVQMLVLIGILALACWERWAGPYDGSTPNRGQSAYYAQLAQEPGDFAVLELPLGRNPGKFYLYYQLTHRKPMVEGLASRTPDGAYDYIEASPLMRAWRSWDELNCSALDLKGEFATFVADDIRYIILHRYDPPIKVLLPYFAGVTPLYEDDKLLVYRTEDLVTAPTCP